MKKNIDKAKAEFLKRKVLTLVEVAELINRNIHAARKQLKEWKAHTSYNKNGRYYALPEVVDFDNNGLWRWHGTFFSRWGNLKQTVVKLIHCSEAGLNSSEIGMLLDLNPRSFLSAFAGHEQLRREKDQGRFIYYGKDVYAAQKQRRDLLIMKARQPTTAEAVAILVEKIKDPALDNNALARRLQKQNLFVDPETIHNLFVLHNLTEKKKQHLI